MHFFFFSYYLFAISHYLFLSLLCFKFVGCII
nr:MAG TPA: hypothetical protein [Inoviridae sp.]